MAEQPQKINKYSLADLKNTTDDAIPFYLNSIGYRQEHWLTDVRLTLGFSACIIAAGTFYYDHKFGFEASKTLTTYAVIAYFALNTALTWWIWGVEAGTVYIGEKDGVKIAISTSVEKHLPYYHVKVKTTDKSGLSRVAEVKDTFTSWFDEDGVLVPKPLQRFLDDSISASAKAKAPIVVKKEKI